MVHIRKKGSQAYDELVISTLNALNFEQVLKYAKKILIKPNLTTTKTASEGVTTDINLICSVVKTLKKLTEAQITVGEKALINTDEVFRFLGVYELEKAGCKVENFEEGEWVEVQPPFSLLFKKFLIPKTAYDCDVIINISKMKTHELTGVTLGIKNFFGLLTTGARQYSHLCDINKGIVDVYSYFEQNKKIISIIDGLVALSGKSGPIIGTPVKLDCLIAGINTVHCDAAAATMIGADPLQIEHIRLAAEVLDVDIRETKTNQNSHKGNSPLPAIDFDIPLMPAAGRFKLDAWLFKNLFYKYPFQKDSSLCTSCRRCESICPKGIVTIEKNHFKYKSSNCIHCLCCIEACNTGAIAYRIRNRTLFMSMRCCHRALKYVKNYKNIFSSTGKN